ncbi:MAG: MFS transporter, partial [Chloroflexia bacterium]|nr:MFS transporter [Chloroflexia bacterium]
TGPIWGAAIAGAIPGADEAWRWVFWLHVPLAALCAWALLSSETRGATGPHPSKWRDFDVLGAVLLAAMLVSLNLSLASGSELGTKAESGLRALGGTPNPLAAYTLPLLGAAAVLAGALILRERAIPTPILPIRLFRSRHFSAAILANALLGGALMVGMVNVPVVSALLVDPEDVSRISALLLVPFTAMIAVGSLLAGRVTARLGVRTSFAVGVALVVVGYIVVAVVLTPEAYGRIAFGLLIAGLGLGLALAPLSGSALSIAAATERGAAASMALVARLLGMTVGISALTSAGVRRLQDLTGDVEPIARMGGESTAAFLERQRQFIERYAIPLSVQVIGEIFLVAAALALLALAPVWFLGNRDAYETETAERSAPSASATD